MGKVSPRVIEAYRVRYAMPHSHEDFIDVRGAVDVHVHGPVLETARAATLAGMRAMVFKTVSSGQAWQAVARAQEEVNRWSDAQHLSPIQCLGAYVIGFPIGPIDFQSIRHAVDNGAAVLWMPPTTSAWSLSRLGGRPLWFNDRQTSHPVPPVPWEVARANGMYVLDDHGKLLSAIRDAIHLASDRGVALSLGHLSRPEMEEIVDEITRVSFTKAFIDHPFSEVFDFSPADLQSWASAGVTLNLTFEELSPLMGVDPAEMVAAVRTVGAEHFVLSSDTGIPLLPDATSSYRLLASYLSAYGLEPQALRSMMVDNPARLLGLP